MQLDAEGSSHMLFTKAKRISLKQDSVQFG